MSTHSAVHAIDGSEETWHALWDTLIREPGTGVAIITPAGDVQYANEQWLRIQAASDEHFDSAHERNLRDLLPPTIAHERLALLDRMRHSDAPVMLRHISGGYQVLSYCSRLHSETEAKILMISRRVGGAEPRAGTEGMEYVESEIVHLGPLDELSPRELEVLALLGTGMSQDEVAKELHRSIRTIQSHRERIGKKLNEQSRVRLSAMVWRAGLTLRDAERKRA